MFLRLLTLAGLPVEPPEPEVAVRDEWPHPQVGPKRRRGTECGFSWRYL
jgi:hypothetical protein